MAKRPMDPELLAEAQRLYEQTLAPVNDICAMLRVSTTYFYTLQRRHGWRPRQAKNGSGHFVRALSKDGAARLIAASPASVARAPAKPAPESATAQQRLLLARRLQSVIGKQIDAIERVTALVGDSPEIGEGARALAAVSRSLREAHELIQPTEAEKKSNDADEAFPYDVEQFRDELSRALRGIIEERRQQVRDGLDEADPAAEAAPEREAED
jgi:hypothetical protein